MILTLYEISSILQISAGFPRIFMALNMVPISQHGQYGFSYKEYKQVLHPWDILIKLVNCVPDKEQKETQVSGD